MVCDIGHSTVVHLGFRFFCRGVEGIWTDMDIFFMIPLIDYGHIKVACIYCTGTEGQACARPSRWLPFHLGAPATHRV